MNVTHHLVSRPCKRQKRDADPVHIYDAKWRKICIFKMENVSNDSEEQFTCGTTIFPVSLLQIIWHRLFPITYKWFLQATRASDRHSLFLCAVYESVSLHYCIKCLCCTMITYSLSSKGSTTHHSLFRSNTLPGQYTYKLPDCP